MLALAMSMIAASATVRIEAPQERVLLLGNAFSAEVASPASVDVPPGRFIAVAYDEHGEVTSVSCPFDAAAGNPVEVILGSSLTADVVAILSGPGVKTAAPLLTEMPPDVLFSTATETMAVWYDVQQRRASLEVKSDVSFLPPLDVRPRSQAVTMVRAHLRKLPSIRLHIEPDGELAVAALKNGRVRVKEEARGVVRELELNAKHEIEIASLQPAVYQVELVLPEWTAYTQADLTAGQDLDATIDVQPISITGRITQSGKPARARVAVRAGKNLPATTTNESGEYELRLWSAGRYQLEVTPAEPVATQPHLDMLLVTGDKIVDVDLPANRFSIRVIDNATRKPIGEANVSVGSARKSGRTMRTVKTTADGTALLPPLFPGELRLQAFADGYFDGEPFFTQVTDHDAEREIVIALHREEETTPLTLLLPDSTPAARAEVIAVRDLLLDGTLWRGRADDAGTIRVPRSMNGAWLAVRHEHAAGTVRQWPSGGTWTLTPPGETLVVRTKDRGGVRVSGWLDGVRVGSEVLAFVAWSQPTIDGAGTWIARKLPAASLRLMIGDTPAQID
jgi:hypothetical protein